MLKQNKTLEFTNILQIFDKMKCYCVESSNRTIVLIIYSPDAHISL